MRIMRSLSQSWSLHTCSFVCNVEACLCTNIHACTTILYIVHIPSSQLHIYLLGQTVLDCKSVFVAADADTVCKYS